VNPVTNKIYVTNSSSNNVTVINGVTNNTATVPTGTSPCAVAVNPVTNMVYVANSGSDNVTVIDGANNATTVHTGASPRNVAVNPVTNRIYVPNYGSYDVTIIDGATNATTSLLAGIEAWGIAVNPVTNKAYVTNRISNTVSVIDDAPANDTKVRAAFDRLPGDTTGLARPALTGKGVNRWTPGRTSMMGVCNGVGTAQKAWSWATVTGGAGTDSITWSYTWGADSLVMGENFVCCAPLEDQAATGNNLGLGSPFAGNLDVYPLYRMLYHAGAEESSKPQASSSKPAATVVRSVLFLPEAVSGERSAVGAWLLDISGRKVLDLHPGANDVRSLAPGVYFVRERLAVGGERNAVHKVVIAR